MTVTISGTDGITTPGLTNTGTETLVNLTTTGNTTLGDASTDTLNVGNGGLVKDASGNVGVGTASPAGKLHVVGAQNAWSQVIAGNTTSGQSYGMRIQSGTTSGDTSLLIRDATNATDYLAVIGNGNVGVGNSSPSAKLQVDASNFALATSYSTLSSNFAVRTTTSAAANVGGEIALGGYSNGTSSPCDFARIHGKKENGTAGNVSGYLAFEVSYDGGPSPYMFERARITSEGFFKATNTGAYYSSSGQIHEFTSSINGQNSIVIRSTTASQPYGPFIYFTGASPNNNTQYFIAGTDTTNDKFFIYSSGTFGSRTSTYGGISDIKVKQDIVDAASQWDDIKALRFRKYRFKDDPTGPLQLGLISQEAELVSPGLVFETSDTINVEVPVLDENGEPVLDEDGTPQTTTERQETGEVTKSVKYSIVYMKAVVALQEAMTRIEEQQALITTLTDRITALENK